MALIALLNTGTLLEISNQLYDLAGLSDPLIRSLQKRSVPFCIVFKFKSNTNLLVLLFIKIKRFQSSTFTVRKT